jgi:hypothetical protein
MPGARFVIDADSRRLAVERAVKRQGLLAGSGRYALKAMR